VAVAVVAAAAPEVIRAGLAAQAALRVAGEGVAVALKTVSAAMAVVAKYLFAGLNHD
jgi:hypothetical protein